MERQPIREEGSKPHGSDGSHSKGRHIQKDRISTRPVNSVIVSDTFTQVHVAGLSYDVQACAIY